MNKLTPVLPVHEIEPSLPFWIDRLGFLLVAQVPHEGRLGFVILTKGPVEVMLQTTDSIAADVPALAGPPSPAHLFIEVEDLDAIERAVAGIELVVPRRQTFYGMDELGVREPGGHLLHFAQRQKGA